MATPKAPVLGGSKAKEVTLEESVFGAESRRTSSTRPFGRSPRCARAHRAERAGVTGGGLKPWRQKGTGRARAGTTQRRSGRVAEWRSHRERGATR